jgi:protein-L-isoaspartate(D-aspartate) O-methyltransferase
MSLYETARANMIECQLRPNKVTDERVLDAFGRVRRELFVPDSLRGVAYVDEDLPLGGGRSMMEPMVAARLLQAALAAGGDNALVIGAGTGYEAAVLSVLARAVVALEEDPALARRAHAALVDHAIPNVKVVEGPLSVGCRERAPYEVILFGGAVAEVPSEVTAQLAEGGRLVAVIKRGAGVGRATVMMRSGGIIGRRVLFDANSRLLPGFRPAPAFVF